MTFVEKYPQNKIGTSRITIQPYIQPTQFNMGLEKANMVLFDNVFQEETLACLEINGTRRYLTGLNEFAPEIRRMKEDDRAAAIRDIRQKVSDLEAQLAANMVDPEDPEFWNKIKLVRPDNDEFWAQIKIRVSNDPIYLDPIGDPYDMIKICAIEAGGFTIVAKSLEDARNRATNVKFFLDKDDKTATIKTEYKKLRNKALAELEKMNTSNQSKMYYIAKLLDSNSAQYRRSTSSDVLYDVIDKYISGEGDERNKEKAAKEMLALCDQDLETLKMRSIVRDASYYGLISTRGDGNIYHLSSQTSMGKNPKDVVMFLKNPINEETLAHLTEEVERHWNS